MKRKLSKESEVELAWQFHNDPALALIYKTFDNFVKSRVGDYQKHGESNG